MKVVLDTNVLISAALFGGVPGSLVDALLAGALDAVTSFGLLDEYERVLVEKFAQPREVARNLRAEIEALAEILEPPEVPEVTGDPADDLLLSVALAANADAVVTGDGELLTLAVHGGIPIVTPRAFADMLESED